MKKHHILYSVILLLLFNVNLFSQTYFSSSLTPEQEVPKVTSPAKGTAVFNLTENGLSFIISVDSIGTITGAHFHLGASGDTGSVVKTITGSFRGNVASGTWTAADPEPLTDEMRNNLLMGKIYVNIHTQTNPSGEVRGQVLPVTGTSFRARFSGLEVVPGTTSGASGSAAFLLTDAGLAYWITTAGLKNISGADFRIGNIGVNGDVLKSVVFDGNKAAGILTANTAKPLQDRLIRAMLLDSVYIAVKTADFPEGEIRGQVIQSGGHFFTANINGGQEVPANNSHAKATGYFTLTPAGLVYSITTNISEQILAVRLLNAPAGMTGEIVKTLSSSGTNGKVINGIWEFDGQEPLSNNIISELLKGNIYINYYTAKFPNGEIRGQITPVKGVGFKARFSSAQLRPATASATVGTGTFILNGEGLQYNITLNGTDTLKSAHIYSGKLGDEIVYVRRYLKSIREFRYASATGMMGYADTTEALTSALVQQLLNDDFFVNVRTTKDTLGAVRGQFFLAGGTSFRASLNARQEVPQVNSNAYGTGSFLLTDQGLTYQITVDSVVVASSHFHKAPAGQNGGVVKDISASFANGTAAGTWMTTGDQNLTADLIRDLLMGNIYVNVHSPVFPDGEIRGQLVLNDGWGFAAQLNGVQVVPSAASAAGGTGAFILTPAGLKYDLTLTGLTPVATTINNAPVSQNGNMIKDITADFKGSTTGHGVWLKNDADTLKPDIISSLINNNLYVSVSTAAFANGEIRGQITETISDALVSVKASDKSQPGSFELKQNYPNPFNPSTNIKFSLPAFSQVELSVFNILGEKVFTLLKQEMAAGTYEVRFNASSLPSGMYIYRLQAGSYTNERKMMLVK